MSDLVEDLAASLKAVLVHAENMTCELDDTDDLSGYPYIQRARRVLARAAKRPRKPPYVLVTVSGGVATIWDVPGVDTDLVDWDNWDDKDPTRDELKYLREVAEQLQDRNDKAKFLREVQELEDRGVAEDES